MKNWPATTFGKTRN